jgi:hypothetical protein
VGLCHLPHAARATPQNDRQLPPTLQLLARRVQHFCNLVTWAAIGSRWSTGAVRRVDRPQAQLHDAYVGAFFRQSPLTQTLQR